MNCCIRCRIDFANFPLLKRWSQTRLERQKKIEINYRNLIICITYSQLAFTMQNIIHKISELDDNRSVTWNQFNNLYNEFSKIHEESFSKLQEEFDKHIKFTKKFKKLHEVNNVIWEVYEEALDGMNKWCENDCLFTLDKKLCSTIHVTRSKGAKLEAVHECSLCLHTHELKHLVKTSCGHYFGKPCFAALIRHKFYNDDTLVTCPNCRSNDFSLQHFKYKK